jgi:hypothetical protein
MSLSGTVTPPVLHAARFREPVHDGHVHRDEQVGTDQLLCALASCFPPAGIDVAVTQLRKCDHADGENGVIEACRYPGRPLLRQRPPRLRGAHEGRVAENGLRLGIGSLAIGGHLY